MKKTMIIITLMIYLSCPLISQAEGFQIDKDGFTQGTMVYQGHTIYIDAQIEDTFPDTLSKIKVEGAGFTQKQIMDAANQCFDVIPGKRSALYPFYFDYGNGEDTMMREGLYRNTFPVRDETLAQKLEDCYAFLDLLEMEYPDLPEHVIYSIQNGRFQISPEQAETEPDVRIGVEIPSTIQGLPLSKVGYRGDDDVSADNVFTDMPWTAFGFNKAGQLIGFRLSFYKVVDSQPIEGSPVAWQETISPALDYMFYWFMLDQKEYAESSGNPDTIDGFFERYDIIITNVRAVWFSNWFNVLRPGYEVYFDVVYKGTHEYVPRHIGFTYEVPVAIEIDGQISNFLESLDQ